MVVVVSGVIKPYYFSLSSITQNNINSVVSVPRKRSLAYNMLFTRGIHTVVRNPIIAIP